MKLYVWNDPYPINYGGCCLYVIARSLKEARRLATDKCNDASYGGYDRRSLKRTHVDVNNKPPTSVHNLPYAEMYRWEE